MALSGSLTKKLFESLSPSSSPREQPTTASSVASDLCRDCQSIDLKARLQCQELRSVASGAIFHLDHVPVNPSSAQCSLCLFLSRCVQEKLAETQFKRNELQGLLSKVTLKRLILTFPYNGRTRTLEGEATQSFIAKIQYGSSWIYALPLGADAFRLANRKESYARLPHPVQADRTLILSWLNECRSRHLSCSKQDKEFHLPINLPGLRLVDVHASCVVRAANEMKEYLTLSYVWGAIDQLVLNVGNIDQLSTPGAFETSFQTQLPQVIVDAMQITQELGFRYLWIDTLCICQDNVEEKTAQIAAMNLIYKGAIMTLVAAEADNAYSGLPGVRPYPQPRETVIERVGLIRLTTVSPPLDEWLGESKWNRRAWTYGEDQFSRRLLYFNKQQVYFRCLLYAHREDTFEEDPGVYTGKGQRILHDFVNQEYGWLQSYLAEFSQRAYTFPRDRLDAFKSILTEMTERAGYQFLEGIPIKDFICALRWKHDRLSNRRNLLYPSWSWAGWDGSVSFPDRDGGWGLSVGGWLPRVATVREHSPRGSPVWTTSVIADEAMVQKSFNFPEELSKQQYSATATHKLYVMYSSLDFGKLIPDAGVTKVRDFPSPEECGDRWQGPIDTTTCGVFSGKHSDVTLRSCELHDQLPSSGPQEHSTSSSALREIRMNPDQHNVTRLSFIAFSVHVPIFLSFSGRDGLFTGHPSHSKSNRDNPEIRLYFDMYTPHSKVAPKVTINLELLLLSTDISELCRIADEVFEEDKESKTARVGNRLTTGARSALRAVSPGRSASSRKFLETLSAGYHSVAQKIRSTSLPTAMMVVAQTAEVGVYERIGIAEWDEHAFERCNPQAKHYILI
jgi:hypothetical protein